MYACACFGGHVRVVRELCGDEVVSEAEQSVIQRLEASKVYDTVIAGEMRCRDTSSRTWFPKCLQGFVTEREANRRVIPSLVTSDELEAVMGSVLDHSEIRFYHDDYWTWFQGHRQHFVGNVDCMLLDPPFNIFGDRDVVPLDMFGRVVQCARHCLQPGGTLLIFALFDDVVKWHSEIRGASDLFVEKASPMQVCSFYYYLCRCCLCVVFFCDGFVCLDHLCHESHQKGKSACAQPDGAICTIFSCRT